jgi:hypothetical protein
MWRGEERYMFIWRLKNAHDDELQTSTTRILKRVYGIFCE